jgi:hypothetical protein
MTSTLPKPISPSMEIVRKIAMDVGKEVVAHIEHAHPEMFKAVRSEKNTKLSIRNATHNAIMAAVNAADEGRDLQWIEGSEAHRRKMRRLQKISDDVSEGRIGAEEALERLRRA